DRDRLLGDRAGLDLDLLDAVLVPLVGPGQRVQRPGDRHEDDQNQQGFEEFTHTDLPDWNELPLLKVSTHGADRGSDHSPVVSPDSRMKKKTLPTNWTLGGGLWLGESGSRFSRRLRPETSRPARGRSPAPCGSADRRGGCPGPRPRGSSRSR